MHVAERSMWLLKLNPERAVFSSFKYFLNYRGPSRLVERMRWADWITAFTLFLAMSQLAGKIDKRALVTQSKWRPNSEGTPSLPLHKAVYPLSSLTGLNFHPLHSLQLLLCLWTICSSGYITVFSALHLLQDIVACPLLHGAVLLCYMALSEYFSLLKLL